MAKIKHSDNTDAVKAPETWITLAVLGTVKGQALKTGLTISHQPNITAATGNGTPGHLSQIKS